MRSLYLKMLIIAQNFFLNLEYLEKYQKVFGYVCHKKNLKGNSLFGMKDLLNYLYFQYFLLENLSGHKP
mgnify:CR=1 FL=1